MDLGLGFIQGYIGLRGIAQVQVERTWTMELELGLRLSGFFDYE